MSQYHELIKSYLTELEIEIVEEDVAEELVVVKDEENGINNLIIDCEHPIVILEQAIMQVPDAPNEFFKRLLQINRTLVHGAFVLDDGAETVIFRDTLQLDNLDLNELEGSISALSLGLAEYGNELLTYVKN